MDTKTLEFVDLLKEWIGDKKGYDIEAIDIQGLTTLADAFVIASGSSDKNVQAIADNIEEEAAEMGYTLYGKEGRQGGRWILLDFGNVIVHIFHREEREFYDLERLWKDGRRV